MFAQMTTISVPIDKMDDLRTMLETRYLPVVQMRPGFQAGYLLEQCDDPEVAELILFWESQAAVENFQRTGLLQASLNSLAAEMPGLRVQRNSYLVHLTAHAPATVARA